MTDILCYKISLSEETRAVDIVIATARHLENPTLT
jgi:hypothetical protein